MFFGGGGFRHGGRRIESSSSGGRSGWECGDGGLDFFAVFLRIGGDPRLDRGAADGRVDEADGDAERLVEFAAEEIQCGGKGADALGVQSTQRPLLADCGESALGDSSLKWRMSGKLAATFSAS